MSGTAIHKQRELFSIAAEFFERATGTTSEKFADLNSFANNVRANAQALGPRIAAAFSWGIPSLQQFYSANKVDLFQAARDQGGLKVVLGGGTRFRKTQLDAVRRLLLYADTVLVPDPLLPWIEVERKEEAFRHVNLLEAMFFLLRLRPLIDGEFGYPPLIVFQSWERTLVTQDTQTRLEVDAFVSNVLSKALNSRFYSLQEVLEFAHRDSERFLSLVDEHRMFVAPGGEVNEPIHDAVERYKHEIRQWRSEEFHRTVAGFNDAELVCNGILERLEPQYHLVQNANELHAQPLFPLEVQAHYFSICSTASEKLLEDNGLITPATRATVNALSLKRFHWLSEVPVPAIAEMRLRNENERFRSELAKCVDALNETSLSDLDRVASEVSRSVGALLNQQQAEAKAMEEKYRPKYAAIAAAGWLALGAAVLPALAPFVACLPPLALTGAYIRTKLQERAERRSLTGSLIGILATAKKD